VFRIFLYFSFSGVDIGYPAPAFLDIYRLKFLLKNAFQWLKSVLMCSTSLASAPLATPLLPLTH